MKFLPILVLVGLCLSCTQDSDKNSDVVTEGIEADALPQKKDEPLKNDPRKKGPEKSNDQIQIEQNLFILKASGHPAYGFWVGMFGKNKINIALYNIKEDSIFGHSVCAGNFRPIKGTFSIHKEKNELKAQLREPGTDKYDGAFEFTIAMDDNTLSGSWAPYKKTTSPKKYTLTKKKFSYDPTLGNNLQSSTEYLTPPDVENLLPEEIEIIRNEIYARHGYSFKNLKIRRNFDSLDWYIPMAVDIRDKLTNIEAHNIDLLYNYEEYYDEYYDEYGR